MSLAKSKTVCSGIEWNSMLGLLVRLKKDNRTIPYLLIGTGSYLGLRAKDLLNIRWFDVLGKDEVTITESMLPGSKNTVKMGIGVQQNREQEYSKNGNKNTVISINIINQGLHCIINKKQDCDGLKNKITYHYVSRDSQAS